MAPPQLSSTTILASSDNITTGPNLYLGPNASIKNTTDGFSTASLAITTNSVLNVGTAININKQSDGTSKLTIDSSGDINTSGYITASGDITTSSTLYGKKLDINNSKCTISDTGLLTIQDDLVVGTSSDFKIQKSTGNLSTKGTLSVSSTTNSAGTLKPMNSKLKF